MLKSPSCLGRGPSRLAPCLGALEGDSFQPFMAIWQVSKVEDLISTGHRSSVFMLPPALLN